MCVPVLVCPIQKKRGNAPVDCSPQAFFFDNAPGAFFIFRPGARGDVFVSKDRPLPLRIPWGVLLTKKVLCAPRGVFKGCYGHVLRNGIINTTHSSSSARTAIRLPKSSNGVRVLYPKSRRWLCETGVFRAACCRGVSFSFVRHMGAG